MIRSTYIFFFIFFFFEATFAQSDITQLIDFNKIESWIQSDSDSIQVINFWATWCKPCVEELPDFQKIKEEFPTLQMKLVSLDRITDVDKRVNRFLKEHEYDFDSYLLTDSDFDSWIPKINKSWDGDIPATVIIHNSSEILYFKVGAIHYEELKEIILNIKNL